MLRLSHELNDRQCYIISSSIQHPRVVILLLSLHRLSESGSQSLDLNLNLPSQRIALTRLPYLNTPHSV